jgi:hypothetical protein
MHLRSSIADPEVFGPPGSGYGSISQGYGYGSGSFYHQVKIVRKTLIRTVLWLFYDFLSLKNEANVPFKKKAGSGSSFISQRHGSADPDLYQHVKDPQRC